MVQSRRMAGVQAPIIPIVADWIRQCPGTISLGQGVVAYGPPPAALARAAAFGLQPDDHKYKPVIGLPALLDAFAAKLLRENGLRSGPGSGSALVITAGANMGFINAVLALVDPGDEVILPAPCYFNHEMAVAMAGGKPVLVPTDARHQLDLQRLAEAITPRTRAIVTVSPNNPTGAVYPESILREVNALCARLGLCHIHDEAYEYFTYNGARAFSPGSIPGAEAHTLSLFSLSKAYGFASWRIGAMVLPEPLLEPVRKIQDTILICAPVVSQVAAVAALEAGRDWCQPHLDQLAATRASVLAALEPLEREGLVSVPPADGAFYCFLRLPPRLPALALAERLVREHRVAVIPGDAFGALHPPALRVAYGALQPATVSEGVGRLVAGLRAILT